MRKQTHKDVLLRRAIFNRDRGICHKCGINSIALRSAFRFKTIYDKVWPEGFDSNRRAWWDVHHINAVCLGGERYDINNCVTMCLKCHKHETKLLAAERALKCKE